MNIGYITSYRLPTEKAHGRQVAQMANAMIAQGHTVTIVAPKRENTIVESFHEYYSVNTAINIQYISVIDWLRFRYFPKKLAFYLTHIEYVVKLKKYLRKQKFSYVITREFLLTSAAPKYTATILELHSIPKKGRWFVAHYYKKAQKIICLTSSMANDVYTLTSHNNIHVEPDAVDLNMYNHIDTQTAREKIGIQPNRTIICYTGKLKTMGMDKGIHDLLCAIKILQPQKHYLCLIVGGPEHDKHEYQEVAKASQLTNEDVVFTGDVPFATVPLYLAASNILTMPWPDTPHYRNYMSPLKMFEYMAAKKPILTGDLPTIREILSEETATFCTPNSPESIAKNIEIISQNYEEAMQKAENAYHVVQQYTWEKRVERIFHGTAQQDVLQS